MKRCEELDDGRLAGAAGADQRDPPPGLEREPEAVEHPSAHVLERDPDRLRRRRRGHGGIGDRRLAIEQLEHPLARRAHAAQVARRRRQRLDGLERGEGQQREHGDEHAIEVGGGEREDAGHGGARDRHPDAVGQPAGQRVAAGDRDERPVGGADPAQRGIAGAVDDELGRAAEQLHQLDRQLGAGGGVAPAVPRLQAVGEQRDRDAAREQAARRARPRRREGTRR